MKARTSFALLLLAVAPAAAVGQELAERIVQGGDGTVQVTFPTREGVEICADGIKLFGNRMHWTGRNRSERDCAPGPLTVDVEVRRGRVVDVEVPHGRDRSPRDTRSIGEVSAEDAVEALLVFARSGDGDRGVEGAVFPMVLADVDEVWRDVLGLAEDRGVGEDVRKSALFWLGQEAASAATDGLSRVASREDEEQEVRDAAVFALSQRPDDEAVPILMDLARNGREPETRKTAFFWLAQADDERVTAFFRDILLGKAGG